MALREMNRVLHNKLGINEINPLLTKKVDNEELSSIINNINQELELRPTNEEIIQALNEKVDKSDFFKNISSKPINDDIYENKKKIDEVQKNFQNFQNKIHKLIGGNEQQKTEIVDLKNDIKTKANLDDVAEALDLKADSENVFNSINEIKDIISNKVDKDELLNIKEEIEKIKNDICNTNLSIKNKSDNSDFKLISDAFQDIKNSMTKRIDDIDSDLDRLIEQIKSQFQSTNVLINEIDNKKIENKDIENINRQIVKKLDEDIFKNEFDKFKNNIFDTMNTFKNDYISNIKMFEGKLDTKNEGMNKDFTSLINEFNKQNNSVKEFMDVQKGEFEKMEKRMETIINNFNSKNNIDVQNVKDDIKKMNLNLIEKLSTKLDEHKFDSYISNIKKELNSKVSLFNNKKDLEEIRYSVEQRLKIYSDNINKDISNKMNDISYIINNKADINLLDQKVSVMELDSIRDFINSISIELKEKINISNFDNYLNKLNMNIDNIHNELQTKANINEVLKWLRKKVNIEDINNLINNIKNDINDKINSTEFNNAMNNQALINDILCNENQIGRWLWKSGKMKGTYTIPWDTQTVNTAPDNFIWEKDKNIINVVKGGIYEICLGFYSNKKPIVQIIVNSEMSLGINNSNNNINGVKNSGKLKKLNSSSLIDFIVLQDNSKIAVTYNGDEGFGFLGLKKL